MTILGTVECESSLFSDVCPEAYTILAFAEDKGVCSGAVAYYRHEEGESLVFRKIRADDGAPCFEGAIIPLVGSEVCVAV